MKSLEEQEQIMLFTWTELAKCKHPELSLLFHIPNGGKRDKITAARLKQAGVKAGVPDLCLPVARGSYHGLYIELKAGKNKPTDKQKEWLASLEKQGYKAVVCIGFCEAKTEILNYLEDKT